MLGAPLSLDRSQCLILILEFQDLIPGCQVITKWLEKQLFEWKLNPPAIP